MNEPSPAPVPAGRGRRQLLLIAALFFVPLALAFLLYYGAGGWHPRGGTNQGELFAPAVPLPEVVLARPDGSSAPASVLRGKWTIAYFGDGSCDERCRKALYLSRQSRIALNKDMDRVQRVFFVTAHCCDTAYLAAEHPDLVVLELHDDAGSRALVQAIPPLDGQPPAASGRLYLIDPLGNLVLSYSSRAPDKALLKDVQKLLRLSHIG